jgi:hypothetical protein
LIVIKSNSLLFRTVFFFSLDMLFERLGEVLALAQLQRAVTDVGTTSILTALAVGALVVLAVDYAWMLYLHFKMVSLVIRSERKKKKRN